MLCRVKYGLPVRRNARAHHDVRTLLFVLLIGVVTSPAFSQAPATGRQELRGHVPDVVRRLHLQPLGQLASTNVLHLAIGLPLRDPDAAKAFLQQLYDPTSPVYHQYLTPDQFAEKFGPTKDDYAAVMNFAKANGLRITAMHSNRLLVDVEGPASAVETAFQVKMMEYQHPTESRKFYAPDVEPSIPSGIAILDVSGLSNYSRPHANSHIGGVTQPSRPVKPNAGLDPGRPVHRK